MTMKDLCLAIVLGALLVSAGCTQRSLTAPSDLVSNFTSAAETSSTSPEPTVTLQEDLTADPAVISVQSGQSVLMVNNSTRYVLVRSYNCSQFSSMGLQPGVSRHTMPFYTAGKTCDYFVWDYPRKIFNGSVNVQ
jgi:hypothetical protein